MITWSFGRKVSYELRNHLGRVLSIHIYIHTKEKSHNTSDGRKKNKVLWTVFFQYKFIIPRNCQLKTGWIEQELIFQLIKKLFTNNTNGDSENTHDFLLYVKLYKKIRPLDKRYNF